MQKKAVKKKEKRARKRMTMQNVKKVKSQTRRLKMTPRILALI